VFFLHHCDHGVLNLVAVQIDLYTCLRPTKCATCAVDWFSYTKKSHLGRCSNRRGKATLCPSEFFISIDKWLIACIADPYDNDKGGGGWFFLKERSLFLTDRGSTIEIPRASTGTGVSLLSSHSFLGGVFFPFFALEYIYPPQSYPLWKKDRSWIYWLSLSLACCFVGSGGSSREVLGKFWGSERSSWLAVHAVMFTEPSASRAGEPALKTPLLFFFFFFSLSLSLMVRGMEWNATECNGMQCIVTLLSCGTTWDSAGVKRFVRWSLTHCIIDSWRRGVWREIAGCGFVSLWVCVDFGMGRVVVGAPGCYESLWGLQRFLGRWGVIRSWAYLVVLVMFGGSVYVWWFCLCLMVFVIFDGLAYIWWTCVY